MEQALARVVRILRCFAVNVLAVLVKYRCCSYARSKDMDSMMSCSYASSLLSLPSLLQPGTISVTRPSLSPG